MHRNVNLARVKGRPVIDSNGDNVGVVEDVVVDPGTWKVSGFVVQLKREVAQRFHLQGGFLDQPRVEVGAERVKTVGDNVILNIGLDVIGDTVRRKESTYDEARPPGEGVAYDPITGMASGAYDPSTTQPTAPGVPFEPPRY